MKLFDRLDPGLAWVVGGLGILLALAAASPAFSAGPQLPPAGPAQREGAPHPGPPAYHAMCKREPVLCKDDRPAPTAGRAGPPAQLTERSWRQLLLINHRINTQIRPEDDRKLFGQADHWTRGTNAGDCDDYMVAKKMALIEAGWPPDQLLYAVVEGWTTRYHAVLIVRTDRGDLVLDNLEPAIRRWDRTGYRFIIRQSADRPQHWVWVLDGPAVRRPVQTASKR